MQTKKRLPCLTDAWSRSATPNALAGCHLSRTGHSLHGCRSEHCGIVHSRLHRGVVSADFAAASADNDAAAVAVVSTALSLFQLPCSASSSEEASYSESYSLRLRRYRLRRCKWCLQSELRFPRLVSNALMGCHICGPAHYKQGCRQGHVSSRQSLPQRMVNAEGADADAECDAATAEATPA